MSLRNASPVFLLFSFLLVHCPCLAQGTVFWGHPVASVEYSPATLPIDQRDLDRIQAVKTGLPLREEDVGATIDALFATGYFKDIQVDAENSASGVVVKYIVSENWFVGHVSIQGKITDSPNEGQIGSVARFNLGTPFDPASLAEAKTNIETLLKNNGLYESQVNLQTEQDADSQQVNITIHVISGKRARFNPPVIQGETKLPDKTIIRATGWRVPIIHRWRLVTDSLTQKGLEGIQKKYQNQDRLSAVVNLKSMDYDADHRRLKPTLDIQAGPKITVKALEAKISKGKLKRYVPVYEEGAVDRDLLVEGARNLRDYFQSKGYPDVDVTFRRLSAQDDQETIEYFIARGQKQKLAHIEIRGNDYFKTDTLRERMFLEPSSLQFRGGRYSEAFRTKDEETIAALYKSNGFRDVKVTSRVEKDYGGKKNQLGVTFNIDQGTQWLVSRLDITGVQQADVNEIRGRLSSGEGQPFSDLNVATDRSAILTYYFSNGFAKATFRWEATPVGPHTVNLRYEITEGPRSFIRNVVINGLHITKMKLVDKNLPIEAGQPLSLVDISTAQQRLYNLGVFAKISAAVQDPDGDLAYKNVIYDFNEAKRYTMNFGFGAEIAQIGGTTNNISRPTGGTGFSPRFSFDISRINFLGLGQTLSLRTRLSNIEQSAALNYTAPNLWNKQGRDLTVSGLYDLSSDVRTFSSRREEASIQLAEPLSKPTTVYLRFAYRRVSTSDVVIPTLLVPQLLQPVRIGILSVNFIQDRRDNPADAHRGIYNTLDVGFASRYFGSQRTFLRAIGKNATYTRIGKNLVFARQTTFGLIKPFSISPGLTETSDVPLPEKFFGGGSISHRGFGENQAGPRDIGVPAAAGGMASQPTGFPLGGNALFFNNLELRFPLLGENISGVIFHDAGNVYENLHDISFRYRQHNPQDFNYMVQAAGFGIRYKTPIGPIRADIAYTLNPPSFVGFKGSYQDLLNCKPNDPNPTGACKGVLQNTGHIQFFFSIGQTF